MNTTIPALLSEAMAHHRAGRSAEARALYERVLAMDESQPDALNLLGVMALADGRQKQAVDYARRAVAAAPGVAEFRNNLGDAMQSGGDLEGAVAAYRDALGMKPDFAQAHDSLGVALVGLERLDEAIDAFRAAVAADAGATNALANLAHALHLRGDLEEAAAAYRRLAEMMPETASGDVGLARVLRDRGEPGAGAECLRRALRRLGPSVDLHYLLGAMLVEAGDLDEAAAALRAVLAASPHHAPARRMLGAVLRIGVPRRYDPQMADECLRFFESDGVDASDVVAYSMALLLHKHVLPEVGVDDATLERNLAPLFEEALFRRVLAAAPNTHPGMERLLVRYRRLLAGRYGAIAGVDHRPPPPVARAMGVLALQCFQNEYVMALEEAEACNVTHLQEAVEAWDLERGDADGALGSAMLVLAMYRPLSVLANARSLALLPGDTWSEPLREVVERTLREPLAEARLRESVELAGPVRDPVSAAVREQYEENPYPRWQWPAHRGREPLRVILSRLLPGFTPPAWIDARIDVLVAGTGTGRHAISVALRYENARIVGTDLSRASLAYAARMAGALGVGNVRFVQNDLLELAALGERFHVIECVGVLHHMADPMAGLRALVARLVPDGLLKLGFYSARAREPVRAAKTTIARLGLAPKAEDIRALRAMALASPPHDALHALLEMPDFYSMSACRDLLFHAYERHFDLEEVAAMLQGAGLELLGFESSDPRLLAAYRRRFPHDPAAIDLASWQVFEDEHPEAFLSMYQLWCRPRRA